MGEILLLPAYLALVKLGECVEELSPFNFFGPFLSAALLAM